MEDRYEPPSQFLCELEIEDIERPENIAQLITLARDSDAANRDWAVFFLAISDVDTATVKDTLLAALSDENIYVRGEALTGLARRDATLALPLVLAALDEEYISLQALEAAAIIGDPVFVDVLKPMLDRHKEDDDPWTRELRNALQNCENSAVTST